MDVFSTQRHTYIGAGIRIHSLVFFFCFSFYPLGMYLQAWGNLRSKGKGIFTTRNNEPKMRRESTGVAYLHVSSLAFFFLWRGPGDWMRGGLDFWEIMLNTFGRLSYHQLFSQLEGIQAHSSSKHIEGGR